MDDKIRMAEKEVRALEKSLLHLEGRNTEYRKSFHRADMTGEDAMKMNQLEDQAKATEDMLFKRKKELSRLEMDIEADEHRMKELTLKNRQFKEHSDHLTTAHAQVLKELEVEKEKAAKTAKKLDRQLKEHRKRCSSSSSSSTTTEEKVLALYNAKEINHSLLYTVGQLAHEFPELRDTLNVHVNQHHFHIPTVPPGSLNSGRASTATKGGRTVSSLSDSRPSSARSDKRYEDNVSDANPYIV